MALKGHKKYLYLLIYISVINNSRWMFFSLFLKLFISKLERPYCYNENNFNLAVFVDMGFDKAYVLWFHCVL